MDFDIEKLAALCENALKVYEEQSAKELEVLKQRLASGNLEPLSEEKIKFYDQLPEILKDEDSM